MKFLHFIEVNSYSYKENSISYWFVPWTGPILILNYSSLCGSQGIAESKLEKFLGHLNGFRNHTNLFWRRKETKASKQAKESKHMWEEESSTNKEQTWPLDLIFFMLYFSLLSAKFKKPTMSFDWFGLRSIVPGTKLMSYVSRALQLGGHPCQVPNTCRMHATTCWTCEQMSCILDHPSHNGHAASTWPTKWDTA